MDFYYTVLSIIFIAPILLFLTTLLSLTLKIFTRKSIRDPTYAPVIGTVFDQLFYFSKLYDQQVATSKIHKTWRLLAPDRSEIYTTDPRNIEHFLKTRFGRYSKGESTQEVWRDLFGRGILMVDGDEWLHQRKLASLELSTRVVKEFSSCVFRENAIKLVGIISELSQQGQAFDMQELLMKYTLDSIFKVGFGADLNCLVGTNVEGNELIKAIDDSNELVYWRYVDPFWKIKRYFNIFSEKRLRKNLNYIHDIVDKLIDDKREQMEKQESYTEKGDILSRFLSASEADTRTMTNEHLRDIILNFIVAGKDTTANTLSWFIYVLCKNPSIHEKLAQEIRRVINIDGNNINSFVGSLTNEAIEEMHFLHATLTETLRLYPGVPVNGMRSENDDTLPDGFKLKNGDYVLSMAYAMGRMSHVWGDDAEEFKPERWLKNGIFQPESAFKFIAFNGGPRTCLGKDFAYRQMKIVSIALVHFFKFKMRDDTRKVTYRIMLTLHINELQLDSTR